ncbi:hypothetical protein [Nostoc sp.]|uniref:hypothetical protein n=1 Tax=Nostoc sp. TaxID=1180 RepID=UPI002FF9E6C6
MKTLELYLTIAQGYFVLNVGIIWYNTAQIPFNVSTRVSQIAIIEAQSIVFFIVRQFLPDIEIEP